eukprot:scaffold1197_cov121-Isochrysis_galbana.AAC.3
MPVPRGRDPLLCLACSGYRHDLEPPLRRGLRGRCRLFALRRSRVGLLAPGGGAEVADPHGPVRPMPRGCDLTCLTCPGSPHLLAPTIE